MSSWEDFKKQGHVEGTEQANRPAGRPIEGNFVCQECYAYVDDGTYYQIDSILKYTCENGHTNFVEKFRLA